MDQGAVDTASGRASTPESPAAAPATQAVAVIRHPAERRRRGRLVIELAFLSLVGVLLVAAAVAAWRAIEQEFYSPAAFVERYIGYLADGRAADALAVPGVTVSSAELEAAGLPPTAHDALLRSAALASISDVHVVSEVQDGEVTRVTVAYDARGYDGTTTFEVVRDGEIGLAPTWRFARSPLAVMNLGVEGSMEFDVNGFTVDKRQVSVDGVDADPLAPVPLLVFSPGLYSVSVDTAISSTPGVAVLSDTPFHAIPVTVTAHATERFVTVVQERVEEFLADCATQQVLQPTGCPFGYFVQDRIDSEPVWSIVQQPIVEVSPDGAEWSILPADAVAHLEVEVRSLYDGEVYEVSEDVPFRIGGTITVQPDGAASIVVTNPDVQ